MKDTNKITRRSDGRLVKTILDEKSGKRLYFYGKSEREINQKILDYSEKEKVGKLFSEVAEEWWETTTETLAPNTIAGYRAAYHRALDYFHNTPINQIKTKDIQKFLSDFAGYGKTAKAKKTVSNQLLILNLIFKYAIREGYIDSDPAIYAKIPGNLKKQKGRHYVDTMRIL